MTDITEPLVKELRLEKGGKTWVLIAPDNMLSPNTSPDIIKLQHPRTRLPVTFLISEDNTRVCEVLAHAESKASWFINDTVQEDGTLHIATPVDPLFLALPYLVDAKNEGKTLPLDDLFVEGDFPESLRLVTCLGGDKLNAIADQKGGKEINAWSYNETKTLSWLKKKTEKVMEVLKVQNVALDGSAVSNTFVMSTKLKDNSDTHSLLPYACSLISEYLPDPISRTLRIHLNLPEEEQNHKRKLSNEKPLSKRTKLDHGDNDLPTPKASAKKPKAPTAKEKNQIRAAAGTKSITSFFKKK